MSQVVDLQNGWLKCWSKTHNKHYWFNKTTKESTFDDPDGVATPPPPPEDLPGGVWMKVWSTRHQRFYFYNKHTKESKFDNPLEPAAPSPPAPGVATPPPLDPASSTPGGTSVADASGAIKASKAVQNFYEGLVSAGQGKERLASRTFHQRGLSNWIKAVLIKEHSPPPPRCDRVLDLACGMGGDLPKWRTQKVQWYVGVDISRSSLNEAARRLSSDNTKRTTAGKALSAKFLQADLGRTHLWKTAALGANEKFSCISCQFALHYLFESEATALTFFRNIADRLQPGGRFIGTIPDSDVIVRRIRDLPDGELSFGNSLFQCEFEPESRERQWCLGANPFGCAYRFTLSEAVGGVVEYLIPFALLVRLCGMVGLKLRCGDNFHKFYRDNVKKDGQYEALQRRMSVRDWRGGFNAEEWEVAGFYRVFAFEKPHDEALPVTIPPPLPEYTDRGDVLPYSQHPGESDVMVVKDNVVHARAAGAGAGTASGSSVGAGADSGTPPPSEGFGDGRPEGTATPPPTSATAPVAAASPPASGGDNLWTPVESTDNATAPFSDAGAAAPFSDAAATFDVSDAPKPTYASYGQDDDDDGDDVDLG